MSCNVSEYFPRHYDVMYNMAHHKILSKDNKKLDEYAGRRCADSSLVEDIHINYCTMGQVEDLVDKQKAPGPELKLKMRFYISFKNAVFAERHRHFNKDWPCEELAIRVSTAVKLTEQSVWLKLQRDENLAAMIWPDFKDKLLPNKTSAMIHYVEAT